MFCGSDDSNQNRVQAFIWMQSQSDHIRLVPIHLVCVLATILSKCLPSHQLAIDPQKPHGCTLIDATRGQTTLHVPLREQTEQRYNAVVVVVSANVGAVHASNRLGDARGIIVGAGLFFEAALFQQKLPTAPPNVDERSRTMSQPRIPCSGHMP